MNVDLNMAQILLYSEFLLALPDNEYLAIIDNTKPGEYLYDVVVKYAKDHYPLITIS